MAFLPKSQKPPISGGFFITPNKFNRNYNNFNVFTKTENRLYLFRETNLRGYKMNIKISDQPQSTFSNIQNTLSSAWNNHKVAILTGATALTGLAVGGYCVANMSEDQKQAYTATLSNAVNSAWTFASNLFKSNQPVAATGTFQPLNTCSINGPSAAEKQAIIDQAYAIAGRYCLVK